MSRRLPNDTVSEIVPTAQDTRRALDYMDWWRGNDLSRPREKSVATHECARFYLLFGRMSVLSSTNRSSVSSAAFGFIAEQVT